MASDILQYKQLKGLKGITAEAREKWEEDNYEALESRGYFNLPEENKMQAIKAFRLASDLEGTDTYKYIQEMNKSGNIDIMTLYNDIYEPQSTEKSWTLNQRLITDMIEKRGLKDEVYLKGEEPDPEMSAFINILRENSWHYNKYWKTSGYIDGKLTEKELTLDNSPYNISMDELKTKFKADVALFGEDAAKQRVDMHVQNALAEAQGFWQVLSRIPLGFSMYFAEGLLGYEAILEGVLRTAVANSFVIPKAVRSSLTGTEGGWGLEDLWSNIQKSAGAQAIEKMQKHWAHDADIIQSYDKTHGSVWNQLADWKTVPMLMQQAGFSGAASVSGATTSAGIKGAFDISKRAALSSTLGKGASALARDDANRFIMSTLNSELKQIAKAEARTNTILNPLIAGASEGVNNALETRQKFIEQMTPSIEEKVEEYKEFLYSSYPTESKEQLDAVVQEYEGGLKHDLYDEADEAATLDFTVNTVINSMIYGTALRGLIGRDYINDAYRTLTKGAEKKIIINDVGEAIVKKSFLDKFNPFKYTKEGLGEFFQESSQTISSSISTDLSDTMFETYLNNKHSAAMSAEIAKPLSEALVTANNVSIDSEEYKRTLSKSLGEHITDKEVLYSGIMGFLGSSIGTFTPQGYRNPIVSLFKENEEETKRLQNVADRINGWLSEEGNRQKFKELSSSLAWAKDMYEAENAGDTFKFESSMLGKTVRDFYLLEQISGSQYYKSLMDNFAKVLAAEEGTELAVEDGKEKKKSLAQEIAEATGGRPLADVKRDVKRMLEIHEEVKKKSKEVEQTLGREVPTNVKEVLVYGQIAKEHFEKRLASIQEKLSGINIATRKKDGYTGVSDLVKTYIAVYGSLEDESGPRKEKIDAIKKWLKETEKLWSLRPEKQTKEAQREFKAKKRELARLEKEQEEFGKTYSEMVEGFTREVGKEGKKTKKINTPVLSIADIMSLDPVYRAMMLNPKNIGKYSQAQRKVINRLLERGNTSIPGKFASYIEDASKLYEELERHITAYNKLLLNPQNIAVMDAQLEKKHALESIVEGYRAIGRITDEEAFFEEVARAENDALVPDPTYTESEQKALVMFKLANLRAALKDNPMYKRYTDLQKFYTKLENYVEKDDMFADVSEEKKRLLPFISSYLRQQKVDISNSQAIYTTLLKEDKEGLNYLFSHLKGITKKLGMEISDEDILDTIRLFKDVINQDALNSLELEKINTIFKVNSENPNAPISTEEKEEEEESTEEKKTAEDIINSILGEGFVYNFIKQLPDGFKKLYDEIIDDLTKLQISTKEEFFEEFKKRINASNIRGNRKEKIINAIIKISRNKPREQTQEQSTPKGGGVQRNYFFGVHTFPSNSINPEFSELWKSWKVEEYLQSIGENTNLTVVYIPADEETENTIKSNLKGKYSEDNDFPIIVAVEVEDGPYKGKYQPIALLPSSKYDSKFNSERSVQLRDLILKAKKENSLKRGEAFSVGNNKIISQGIRYESVKLSGAEETDTNSITFLKNSEQNSTEEQVPKGKILGSLISIKKSILDDIIERIKVVRVGKKGDEARRLKLSMPNSPTINVLTESIRETPNHENPNQTFRELLDNFDIESEEQPEGLIDAIINFNFLTRKLATTLKEGRTDPFFISNIRSIVFHNDAKIDTTEDSLTISLGDKRFTINYNVEKELLNAQIAGFIQFIANAEYNGHHFNWQIDFPKEDASTEELESFKKFLARGMKEGIFRFPVSSIQELQHPSLEINNPEIPNVEEPKESKETVINSETTSNFGGNIRTKEDGTIYDSDTGEVLRRGESTTTTTPKSTAANIVKKLQEDSKKIQLTEDGTKYEDGQRTYTRVTSLLRPQEESNEDTSSSTGESYKIISTSIGNAVDELARAIFTEGTKVVIDNTKKEVYLENSKGERSLITVPLLKPTAAIKLVEALKKVKDNLETNGLTVVSRDLTVSGEIVITNNEGNQSVEYIAGSMDLLAYDTEGNFHIIDIKTYRSKDTFSDVRDKYIKQVSLYKYLLEQKYGIKVKTLNLLPIQVDYAAPKGQEYTMNDQGEVLFRGKKYDEVGIKIPIVKGLALDVISENEVQNVLQLENAIAQLNTKEIQEAIPLNTEVTDVSIHTQPVQQPTQTLTSAELDDSLSELLGESEDSPLYRAPNDQITEDKNCPG